MLKKNYINHDERQRWLQMVYLGEALDKVIESKTDYGKAKSDLKRGRTYILKAIEEFGEIYPKVIKTILNDTGYYDMSFLPKSQSRKVYEKYLDSEKLKAMLNRYKSNKFQIEFKKQLRIQLCKITSDDIPSCTPVYSDMPKGTGSSDSTYNTVAKKETTIELINDAICELECEVKIVDALIGTLKYRDQIFIRKIIEDKKSLKDIMHELQYTEYSNVQRAYSRIMNELEKEYNK